MKFGLSGTPKVKMARPAYAQGIRPPKMHPAARVRLPQGMSNVRAGDPGVFEPGIGKI